MLDVSDRLAGPDGKAQPIEFGLNFGGVPFHLRVADVTREQIEEIKRDSALLPPGWSLDGNQIWVRRR